MIVLSVDGMLMEREKARWRFAGGLIISESLWLISSSQVSSPTWLSHDDGGDRDGGGSASSFEDKGGVGFCQIVSCRGEVARRAEGAENGAMRRVMVIVLTAVIGAQGIAAGQADSRGYATKVPKTVSEANLVDLNRASAEELMKLPGMTKVWADRVVKFRPYKRKTELLEHGVLPDRVYDKVKDFVVAHKAD